MIRIVVLGSYTQHLLTYIYIYHEPLKFEIFFWVRNLQDFNHVGFILIAVEVVYGGLPCNWQDGGGNAPRAPIFFNGFSNFLKLSRLRFVMGWI
jgi:hypothetical protein